MFYSSIVNLTWCGAFWSVCAITQKTRQVTFWVASTLSLVPISTNIFITLIIQNNEINCTGGHTEPIKFFSFIAPFQGDVAERWNLWYLSLCHIALSHDFKEMLMIFLNLLVCCHFLCSWHVVLFKFNPANDPLFKLNSRNTETRCEIRSKLTIMILERRHLHCSGVFIVNFWTRCSSVSYVYWEKI